jgi:hypothetical protein
MRRSAASKAQTSSRANKTSPFLLRATTRSGTAGTSQPCHERSPVEREVKADGGHHDQRWQPMQVQSGEASKAEPRRAKGFLVNVEVEEQNQSARERQERGDKENNTNKELETIATHALTLRACAKSRAA